MWKSHSLYVFSSHHRLMRVFLPHKPKLGLPLAIFFLFNFFSHIHLFARHTGTCFIGYTAKYFIFLSFHWFRRRRRSFVHFGSYFINIYLSSFFMLSNTKHTDMTNVWNFCTNKVTFYLLLLTLLLCFVKNMFFCIRYYLEKTLMLIDFFLTDWSAGIFVTIFFWCYFHFMNNWNGWLDVRDKTSPFTLRMSEESQSYFPFLLLLSCHLHCLFVWTEFMWFFVVTRHTFSYF